MLPQTLKKTKIAVAIPKYNVGGGAEFYCASLSDKLAENNLLELHVFANRHRNQNSRIQVHTLPILKFPKWLTTPSFAFFARNEITKLHFDLIHAHDRIFKADIYTMHGIPHRYWIKEVRRKRTLSLFDHATVWTERQLLTKGHCRRFLAVSALTRELFMREYPEVDPEKIEIVRPGITLKDIRDTDRGRSRLALAREYGIEPDERIILFVSMNFDIKGLDFVLNGLSRLKSLHPLKKWKLLVVGKGDARRYSRRAAMLGIADRVKFAGTFSRDRLHTAYSGSDLFVMPSKFDTFGMTVLEAMAASLPVLISDNVGARDLVDRGTNGFVLDDPENKDEFAGRIQEMMDENVRIKMADACLATAQRHTWDVVALEMERIYADVLREKCAGSK